MISRPLSITGLRIRIDTNNRKLQLYDGDRAIRTYPVGIGKWSTPTPHGTFRIRNKIINPGGVLGSRWMGLDVNPHLNYGIHGTNNPSSIGGYVSKGCVRMYNSDVEELFALVSIGTTVIISGSTSYEKEQLTSNISKNKKAYTVKSGDTLWNLAKSFGVPLKALVETNLITDPTKIYPGQKIIIP